MRRGEDSMCKGPVGGECWTRHRNGGEARGWHSMSMRLLAGEGRGVDGNQMGGRGGREMSLVYNGYILEGLMHGREQTF